MTPNTEALPPQSVQLGGPDAPYRQPQPMRFARMLKLYIAAHDGLTQKQVAQQAGVGESTLSRFLSGEQVPDGKAFAALLAWSLEGRQQ